MIKCRWGRGAIRIFGFILILALNSVPVGAADSIHRPATKASAHKVLSESERRHFRQEMFEGNKLFDAFHVKEALPHFEKAYALDPLNYEAQVKLLRTYNAMGQDSMDRTEDHDRAEFYFRKNIEIAEGLVEKFPKSAEAWFAKAVTYGNLALYSPAKEKVQFAQNIEKMLKTSIELDPNYPYAYLGLAIFYREVSQITFMERFFANLLFGEIPQATLELSEEYFKKSIERDPNFVFARFHYGKCLEYADRIDEAVAQYDLAIRLPQKDFGDEILKKKSRSSIEELRPGYFRTLTESAERSSN